MVSGEAKTFLRPFSWMLRNRFLFGITQLATEKANHDKWIKLVL